MRGFAGLSFTRLAALFLGLVLAGAMLAGGASVLAGWLAAAPWGDEAVRQLTSILAGMLGAAVSIGLGLWLVRCITVSSRDDRPASSLRQAGLWLAPLRKPARQGLSCVLAFLLAFSLLGDALPAWGDEPDDTSGAAIQSEAEPESDGSQAEPRDDSQSGSDSHDGEASDAADGQAPAGASGKTEGAAEREDASATGPDATANPGASDAGAATTDPADPVAPSLRPPEPDVEPSVPVPYYDEPETPEGKLVAVEGDAVTYQLSPTNYRTVIGGADTAYVNEEGEPVPVDNTLQPMEGTDEAPPVLLSLFAADASDANVEAAAEMEAAAPDAQRAAAAVPCGATLPTETPGPDLIEVPADSTVYEPAANGFGLQLPAAMGEGRGITVEKDGHTIELIPVGGDFTNSAIDGNAIRFTEVRPGADYQYTLVGGVLKEDIVLTGPAEPFDLRTRIFADDDLEVVEESGLVLVRERAAEGASESGPVVLTLAAPIAVDAAEAVDNTLTMNLTADEDGAPVAEVGVNWDWLLAPERAYPVRIDPAIDISSTAMRLTSVEQLAPKTYIGENNYQYAGYDDGYATGTADIRGSGLGITRVYLDIRYDFGTIMDEARIDKAELSLHQRTKYSKGATKFGLYRNKQDWDFGSVTWNSQVTMEHEFVQYRNANAAKGYVVWDVREPVNNWVQGIWGQQGLCVKAEDERNMQCELFDHRYSANPPKLEIDWAVPDPVSESTSLDATTINLRPVSESDISGRLLTHGVFADGVATPRSMVAYELSGKGDTGVAYASRSYKYPDSSEWEAKVPNATKYRDKLSNWQSKLFGGLAFNTVYKVQAQAAAEGRVGKAVSSDSFLIYKATAKDTLPYIAAHYQMTAEALAKDNHVQDSLVVDGNTIFVRNPKTTAPYSPKELTDDQKRRIDSALMGRGKHCEYDFEPINLNTGNFILEAVDASVPEISGPFSLMRTYNAQGGGYRSSFGRNWSFAWDESLGLQANGAAVYSVGDGKTFWFDADGKGGFKPHAEEAMSLKKIAYKEGSATRYRWETTEADGTVRRFDKWGRLYEVANPQGGTTQVQRDSAGKLSALVTPTGVRFGITCNATGLITAVTLPSGGKLTYTYDGQGNLTGYTDAAGGKVRYVYDAAGRMTEWYDQNGRRVVQNTYDAQNRVVKQLDLAGRPNTLSYGSGFTRTVDAAGRATVYRYDARGRTVAIEYPNGDKVERSYGANNTLTSDENGAYTYDARGNRLSHTSPDGHTTCWAYDGKNRVTSETAPDGAVTTYTYDAKGNLVRVDHPATGATTFAYDAQGRMTSKTDADGVWERYTWSGALMTAKETAAGTTTYTYDAMGRLVSTADPTGATTKTFYDGLGRVTGRQDGTGAVTRYQLDAIGLMKTQTDPDGSVTVFDYDSAYQLTSMTDPDGGVTRWTYDAAGNQTSETNAAGATTTWTYDGRDRMVSETNALGYSTTYAHDARGNLVRTEDALGAVVEASYDDTYGVMLSLTDERGSTAHYEYDAAGRLTRSESPQGAVETTEYAPGGLAVSQTDARGTTTAYTYTDAGRVASIDSAGRVYALSYDEVGNVAEAIDPVGNTYRFKHDAMGNVVELSDDMGVVGTWAYDGAGRVVSEGDALGNAMQYAWDTMGNRTAVTDPLGHVATYRYDEFGALVGVTDSVGNEWRYAYDLAGNLVSTTDPAGNTRTAEYDAAGNLVRLVDGRGVEAVYEYDALGQVTAVNLSEGVREEWTYDASGNVVSHTDGLGFTTTCTWDADRNLIEVADETGRVESYKYRAGGDQVAVTDALGRTTETEYDPWGAVVREVQPGGVTTQYERDALGRVTRTIDALGNATRFAYDARGRATQVEREADGAVTAMEWDAAGALLSVTDALGAEKRWAYDATGNMVSAVDEEGNATSYAYDALGNVVQSVDPLGNVTSLEWDSLGNLAASTSPEGSRDEWLYDGEGNLIGHTDPLGHTEAWEWGAAGSLDAHVDLAGARTEYAYDAVGNLLAETDPLGRTTSYERDAHGNVIARTTSGGARWEYGWDALDRLISVKTPRGYERQLGYDEAGNAVSDADNMGLRANYAYDALGRMVEQRYGSQRASTWQYDAAGNLVGETDARGSATSHGYDLVGRLTETRDASGAETRWAYDVRGNVIAQGGTAAEMRAWAWDAAGNLVAETDGAGKTTAYEWDGDGRLVGAVAPTGARTAYRWDAAGNLASITDSLGNIESREHDPLGRTTKITDRRGAATMYEYDAAGQLTGVTQPSGARTIYDYDVDGNLTEVTDALGRVMRYGYDAEGGLISIESPSGALEEFVRDPAGRVIASVDGAGAETRYNWDELGNLVEKSYSQEGAQAVLYSYDENGMVTGRSDATGDAAIERDQLGRIVAETDGEGRRIGYAYDDRGNLTEVTYPDGSKVAYVYDGEGNLETVRAPEGDYRYAYNEVGSPVSLKRPDGTTTTYEYDSEGRLLLLENRGAGGALISSFAYGHDDEGNPVSEVSVSTDAAGAVTRSTRTFSYDADGRLASFEETFEGPAPAHFREDYEWDAVGNRIGVTHTDLALGGIEKTSYRYDDDDRLVSEVGSQGATSYEYDKAGNLVRKAAPDADPVEYAWAVENRLAAVRQGGRVLMAATYDGDGNKVLQSTLYHTDEIQRSELPADATAAASDFATRLLFGNALKLPLAGKAVSANVGTAAASAEDAPDRTRFGLVEWFLWGASHSLAGSLAPVSLPAGMITALLAEAALLGPQGGCDPVPGRGLPAPPGAAALLAEAGVRSVELLAMASDAGPLPLKGGASGAGDTEKRPAIPVETPYVQERWELVAYVNSTVVDAVAQPMARYSDVSGGLNDVYGLGRLSTAGGTAEAPVAATYLADGLGSVSAVLDGAGAVSANYHYSPWGEASGAGELPAYGYNAEEATAAAGLQYLRARWYDPGSAAFASRDAYLGRAAEPSSLNRYAYAEGNPVGWADPTGHSRLPGPHLNVGPVVQTPTSWLQQTIANSNSQRPLYNRDPTYRYDYTWQRNTLPHDSRPLYDRQPQQTHKPSGGGSGGSSGGGKKSGSNSNARTQRALTKAEAAQATASLMTAFFCGSAPSQGGSDAQGGIDWAAIGHGALDLAGFIPGFGAAADVANGLWYAAEGNWGEAAASFLSAIPGVGDAFGGANAARKAVRSGLSAFEAATPPPAVVKVIKQSKSSSIRAELRDDGVVDLVLKKKDIWDEMQMSQATRKAQDLSRADTVKTKPGSRNGSASDTFKKEYGKDSVPDGYDVDHVIDLQLGGADHVSNMRPLDASVNRSMGAQINYLIRDLPEGTKIGNVRFE